jgi:hypothetical protein
MISGLALGYFFLNAATPDVFSGRPLLTSIPKFFKIFKSRLLSDKWDFYSMSE